MFNVGPMELIVILLVALLVVGPKRLPEVGRTIGKSLRELRRASEEVRYSFEANLDDEPSGEADEPVTAEDVSPDGSEPSRPGSPSATDD
jgi:Tat protein translocase TatB subunit